MSVPAQIALVTGANRGIGLEVCRQLGRRGFSVLLGARDMASGEAAAARLQRQGLNVLLKKERQESFGQQRCQTTGQGADSFGMGNLYPGKPIARLNEEEP